MIGQVLVVIDPMKRDDTESCPPLTVTSVTNTGAPPMMTTIDTSDVCCAALELSKTAWVCASCSTGGDDFCNPRLSGRRVDIGRTTLMTPRNHPSTSTASASDLVNFKGNHRTPLAREKEKGPAQGPGRSCRKDHASKVTGGSFSRPTAAQLFLCSSRMSSRLVKAPRPKRSAIGHAFPA